MALGLGFLAHDADALGAHVLANHVSIFQNPDALDVRLEHPVGPTVGVADIVPKQRGLATNFTLCHGNNLARSVQVSGRHATIEQGVMQGLHHIKETTE